MFDFLDEYFGDMSDEDAGKAIKSLLTVNNINTNTNTATATATANAGNGGSGGEKATSEGSFAKGVGAGLKEGLENNKKIPLLNPAFYGGASTEKAAQLGGSGNQQGGQSGNQANNESRGREGNPLGGHDEAMQGAYQEAMQRNAANRLGVEPVSTVPSNSNIARLSDDDIKSLIDLLGSRYSTYV